MSTFQKCLYLYNGDKNVQVVIRNYGKEDFAELIRIQQESFPPPFPSDLWWNEEQLNNHITLFPEGALCVEVDGVLAGSMTSLIVNFDTSHLHHTWGEITDHGYIRNHNPNGNTLYGVDICIRPSFRKLNLGKWLMQSMFEVVVHQNLDRFLGGGRMPGYHKRSHEMTAEKYLEEVVQGKIKDKIITFFLNCGVIPLGTVENYLEDEESHNYAALLEWRNPFKSTEDSPTFTRAAH